MRKSQQPYVDIRTTTKSNRGVLIMVATTLALSLIDHYVDTRTKTKSNRGVLIMVATLALSLINHYVVTRTMTKSNRGFLIMVATTLALSLIDPSAVQGQHP